MQAHHQRGIVVHATSDALVKENVVMYSKGHLLMTEDSLEEGTNLCATCWARHDSAEDFSRLGGALLFTATGWIFIPAYCFAIP